MPLPQLLTSAIEIGINQLLALDPDSPARLAKLKGKTLQVKVKELPWPLIFSFSDQVDVRTSQTATNEQPEAPISSDCFIELNLETLPKLKDSSQLTQLIQQQKLNLIGDIYIAQTFSTLIKDLDIDWEEQLSQYTGDVVAHQTFSTMQSAFSDLKRQLTTSAEQLSNKLTEPNGLSVSKNEFFLFSDDVSDIRSHVERLDARLAILEQKQLSRTSNTKDDTQ